jgi:spore germination protein YaaH
MRQLKKVCLWLLTAVFLSSITSVAAAAAESKFSMSYIYFGNSSAYASLVDGVQDSLNEVAPNYFTLDGGGNLTLTNAVSPGFVYNMHARGIRVVPYLSNDWSQGSGAAALSNRDALSTSLAAAVSAYNLDGVNLDIENMNQDRRSDYVDFARLLREKLPAGKTIAVAVAANPWGAVTGWQGSYDYAGLARYCDYLMIMAYDEHYDGSVPGPVGSMSFTERSIAYALSQTTKDKLVLGLPFYGRVWSDSGAYPKGYGVSHTRIAQLLTAPHGTVAFDEASRSAVGKITVGAGDSKPVVGGKVLAAGTYTIWFDSAQTIKEKLSLVQKYDLKGAGNWSLGQEDDNTWSYYKLWLNGCTFGDIENNWARDDILSAFMQGWVNGTAPDTFSPDAPLTRAEAAVIMVRALGFPVESDPAYDFSDIKSSWAADYINTARRYNLISGVGGNRFAPDQAISRQEVAVLFSNATGYHQAGQTAAFADVSRTANPWSYGSISALSAGGIITGFPDGTFRPEVDVSRAEMTTLLIRLKAV